jgi:hypothetical protein
MNCARAGDRAGLFCSPLGIDRDSAGGLPPALRALHGSGTLITAVHCFGIVFSTAPRSGGMHFCLVACGSINRHEASPACFFSCYLQANKRGVHPCGQTRKPVDRFHETDQRRVGKIAWHCDQDYAEPRNFAHAFAPRAQGAWATRRYAVPRSSRLRPWRVTHPTRSPDMIRILETMPVATANRTRLPPFWQNEFDFHQ